MSGEDVVDMLTHHTKDTGKSLIDFEKLCNCMDMNNDGNVSLDEEFDFITRLDRNCKDKPYILFLPYQIFISNLLEIYPRSTLLGIYTTRIPL